MTEAALLASGVTQMGLDVSRETQDKLLAYMELLQKWNKVYNLTAVRDPKEMVALHLLDSLSVLPYVDARNMLDVGSGAGLPGIVMAIVKPELKVTTIDTVQKKAIFMRQVKGELNLHNLEVVHARVESYQAAENFEIIISRAFSELALFVNLTKHLLAEHGVWLAMKGQIPHVELNELDVKNKKIIPLSVAGLEAERHLVVLEN